MIDTINTTEATPSVLEVSFAWTPADTFAYTAPSGLVITSPNASHSTLLTFTAAVTIENQGDDFSGPVTIVEYRWDFGDGVYGYGNPVTHTYAMDNFQAQAALRVTDSKGRCWYTRAQMYLGLSTRSLTGGLGSTSALAVLPKPSLTGRVSLTGSLVPLYLAAAWSDDTVDWADDPENWADKG